LQRTQAGTGKIKLTIDQINQALVEQDLDQIAKIREIAWQRSPENLLALMERLQVKLLTDDMPRRRRRVYRSIIDYFEDVLEERIEKDESKDRAKVRRTGASYLRGFLKSMDDD
tara:strand:- start:11754 stop:12095 length:342 start_codon:yes stop_codon:yes gene_type:complete